MADATQEFKVEQNTAFVEQATSKMHPGAIDKIEQQALATQTTIRITQGGADEAERKLAANSHGTAEGNLYGNILSHTLGVGAVGAIAEFVDTRRTDKAYGIDDGARIRPSKAARTIDQDIESAKRKPGVYRDEPEQSVYASAQVADRFIKRTGGDIFAGAMIAGDVLNKQPKDATATWKKIDPSNMISGVKRAKEMTCTQEIASEHALNSVVIARREQSAQLGHMQRMAGPGLGGGTFSNARMYSPHLDLHNGPRPPDERAFIEADDSRRGAYS